MSHRFEKYAREENIFFHQLAGALGYTGEIERTRRVFRSTLHALRDYLTLRESLLFLEQLPMFIKTIYSEGWMKDKHRKIKNFDEFLFGIWAKDGRAAQDDFEDREETIRSVTIVFMILGKFIPEEKMNELESILPREMKALLTEAA